MASRTQQIISTTVDTLSPLGMRQIHSPPYARSYLLRAADQCIFLGIAVLLSRHSVFPFQRPDLWDWQRSLRHQYR